MSRSISGGLTIRQPSDPRREKVAQNIALGTRLITAENVDSGGEEITDECRAGRP